METTERNWHIDQAELIRDDERAIRNRHYALALHYYEVGARLTQVYGVFDGSQERSIPVTDKAELAQIYGVPISALIVARRVFRQAPEREIFESVLDGYGSWDAIVHGWLAEKTTGKTVQQLLNDRKAGTPAKIHIVNVPDRLRDGLVELGLSREEARRAIFEFLSNATPNEIKLVWEVRTGKRQTDTAGTLS